MILYDLHALKLELLWFACFVVVMDVASQAMPTMKCGDMCTCIRNAMTCQMYIPHTLPDGIQSLTVEGNANESNVNEFWSDSTWKLLRSLTLRNYTNRGFDEIYAFRNLDNLEYFGLHSPRFYELENEHLKAMPKLKELNLSKTANMLFPTIIAALSGGNLPNLEVLNLDAVGSDTRRSSPNIFGSTFINVLKGKPLKRLTITNTMLIIDATLIFNGTLPSLEFLNISGPWIPMRGGNIIPANIGHSKCLQTIDLSVSMIPIYKTGEDLSIQHEYSSSCVFSKISKILWTTTNVFLNDIVDMQVLLNGTYNVTNCLLTSNLHVSTKTLHLRNNGLKRLDIKFVDDLDIGLTILDLSENILEFILPDFFKVMGSLSNLDLGSNYLHKMEPHSQFKLLFVHLKRLKTLRLSSNELTFLPKNMFLQNQNLVEIDILNNNILNVDFTIGHLRSLKILNVARNDVKFLESGFIQQLDKLSIYPSFQSADKYMIAKKIIILADNPLQCSCDSVAFLTWLLLRYNLTESEQLLTCLLEGTATEIDEDVKTNSKYLCIKAIITTVVCTMVVIMILLVFVALYACYVRHRCRVKQARVEKLIQTLRDQLLHKYLIYLSYCEDDEELVLNEIYPKLSQELLESVGLDREFICVGVLKLRLGHYMHEEMLKCLSESCVAMFIVSNGFCNSPWCETEIKEAATQNKPITLFLMDDVDESLMPHYLRTLFHRYMKVSVTNMDRNVEITPDVKMVLQSLLELAADNRKYGGFYEIFLRHVYRKKNLCC